MDEALRAELLARRDADQEARLSLPRGHSTADWNRVVDPVDADNERWIRDVIARHGWPGSSLVGTDGAQAAWLLVQHAPLDLQEQCLPLLTAAVDAGEADPADNVEVTAHGPAVLPTAHIPCEAPVHHGNAPGHNGAVSHRGLGVR